MSPLAERGVRLSAVIQFASGKIGLVLNTVTAATALSIKFHIFWPLMMLVVILFSLGLVVVVVKSGWYHSEMRYVGDKMLKELK